MRLISKIKVRNGIPESWIKKALDKTEELKLKYQETAGARASDAEAWRTTWSKTVEGAKSIWQDKGLKQAFINASNGKCWYCEANVTERGDVPIDHFRPKNRVHEDKAHEGYWWLACDWTNYRYACSYCNSLHNTETTSGGKQDRFPLWDEKGRARAPDGETDGEQPLLLDPMKATDVALLSFDRSGIPVPVANKKDHPLNFERAQESIKILHLHRGDHNSKRKDIMTRMEAHLVEADRQARKLGDPADVEAQNAYNRALDPVVEYVTSQAEFSSAARAYLGSMRGTSKAAAFVLENMIFA